MSDIKESFLNKVDELREKRLDEMSPELAKRYYEKSSEDLKKRSKKRIKNREEHMKNYNTMLNRSIGQDRAMKRINVPKD